MWVYLTELLLKVLLGCAKVARMITAMKKASMESNCRATLRAMLACLFFVHCSPFGLRPMTQTLVQEANKKKTANFQRAHSDTRVAVCRRSPFVVAKCRVSLVLIPQGKSQKTGPWLTCRWNWYVLRLLYPYIWLEYHTDAIRCSFTTNTIPLFSGSLSSETNWGTLWFWRKRLFKRRVLPRDHPVVVVSPL